MAGGKKVHEEIMKEEKIFERYPSDSNLVGNWKAISKCDITTKITSVIGNGLLPWKIISDRGESDARGDLFERGYCFSEQ